MKRSGEKDVFKRGGEKDVTEQKHKRNTDLRVLNPPKLLITY